MTPQGPQAGRAQWRTTLSGLSPAYFGLVMATGIVSLAAEQLGWPVFARVLFVLNVVQYPVLLVLYAWRAWRHPHAFFGDLVDHQRGPGYFTVPAATGVLASQWLLQAHSVLMGQLFFVLTLVSWAVLNYAIFLAFTVKTAKPALDRGISGGWLLAVVATQAVAVSATLLATALDGPWSRDLLLLALAMWLWAGMLYVWLMALIFYRCIFFVISPDELSPPYWISMGAMAISTLAGSLLIENATQAPLLASLRPFLTGFTVFYWASGTWWVPLLLLLGVWRYGVHRYPFRYDPLYWGAVFPLGMYSACTWQLNRVLEFAALDWLAQAFLYAAVLAWVLTFGGLVHHLVRGLRAFSGGGAAARARHCD